MSSRKEISRIYDKFCTAEGNQHIASEFAIYKIQQLTEKFKISSILEIGLGIGSIAGSLLSFNPHINYTGTEANEFCLQALKESLQDHFDRINIVSSIEDIPENLKVGLIIIDGKDPQLSSIKNFISANGIIAIEGDRVAQQEILEKLFPQHKYVHAISLRKNSSPSPFPAEEWQGGLKIFFTDPTCDQYLWWLKEKFITKLKYQVPGRYFGNR